MAIGAAGPTIVAKFIADTSKVSSEVDSMATSTESRLGSMAKKAALALGGAFVVDKVVDFGRASVEAAAADAEAQAKLATTLKNVTGATDAQVSANEDYISSLSKQTAIADDDLRPAMDQLVRGFGSVEEAQKALALATDVSAGTGKDLTTVTTAMQKAAMGQTGALKKLGVETKNADGSAKSLDQIMADMAQTFQGQAATAADSAAGRMRSAKIAFGEFQEQVGSALIPVLATLATFFTGTLLPAISGIADWIGDHKTLVISGFIGIGVAVLAAVIPLVPAFIAWAGAAAAAAAATLVALAPVIAIGAAVAAAAYLIITNWDTIASVAETVWDAVLGFITGVWDWIQAHWPLLLTILTGPFGAAVTLIVKNWDTIQAAILAVWDWIRSNWPTLLAVLTGPFGLAVLAIVKNWDTIKAGAQAVWDWLNGTWQSISSIIVAPIRSAVDIIKGIWQELKDAATGAYNWVRDKFNAMGDAISDVIGGIRSAVSDIVSAIKTPINAVIRAWNQMEFRVPSFTLPSIDFGPVHIGGYTFGGQTIGFPDIPQLAKGGVLDVPTLFIGGEAGREIVSPEELLRAIVAEESGGGNYTLNLYPRTADAADVAYGFRRLELMAAR